MSANASVESNPNKNEPCRGDCSGYGTRCSCPPLIVLAMHTHRQSEIEFNTHRLHQRHSPVPDPEARRLGHFSSELASPEYCNCLFSYREQQAGAKTEM